MRAALAAVEIPSVLLKGRGFAALLYAESEPRAYGDCDLLIPAALRDRAGVLLNQLGFVAGPAAPHSVAWRRDRDNVEVDLHHTLPHVSADPDLVWAVLSARTICLQVGNQPTTVLDPPATALLCALHLVHHGRFVPGPREDLIRAVERFAFECWRDAADVARELGATAELGTGLRLVPGGEEIAQRLSLPWAPSGDVLWYWGAPWQATIWESILTTPGIRPRARLIAGFLVADPEQVRTRYRVARLGRIGLLAAYGVRAVTLAARMLGSISAWRVARRAPGHPDTPSCARFDG